MIERDVVGGAAHLWDCIPSKTMIATGGAMSFSRRIHGMGLQQQDAEVDALAPTERIDLIKQRPHHGVRPLLKNQGGGMIDGTGPLLRPRQGGVTPAAGGGPG